jgi:hypothetical protein
MHTPTVERCERHRGKPGSDLQLARRGGQMNKNFFLSRHLGVVVLAVSSFLFGAMALANTPPSADIKQVGATAIVYKGPQIDAALSYRFAKLNPSGNWLLLDTAMTATASVELQRTAISVRTPDGEVVPLASPEAFNNGYHELNATIARANVAREPLGYLIPRRARRMGFFAERRLGLMFPSAWLDEWHISYGRLFFQLPDGVQRGNYELLINLKEGQVAIPFTI